MYFIKHLPEPGGGHTVPMGELGTVGGRGRSLREAGDGEEGGEGTGEGVQRLGWGKKRGKGT